MLTGRRALSGCVPFLAPKAQGMVSSLILPFPAVPWLPFLSHIFSIAGSKQSGEGAESRARVVGAFIGAKAQTLDSAPALGTLPGEKMGDFSRCFLFNTFTRTRRRVYRQSLAVEDFPS